MLNAETRYKSERSDEAFQTLLHEAESKDNYCVAEFLLSILPNHPKDVRALKHLAESFAMDGRYLEAHSFCKLWQARDSSDVGPWRLAAIISAHRCDLPEIELARKKLSELKAPENIQWMALTLQSLVFWNARQADVFAAKMLLSGPLDPIFLAVALDVSFRTMSPNLLFETVIRAGKEPELPKRRTIKARKMLVEKIVSILHANLLSRGASSC